MLGSRLSVFGLIAGLARRIAGLTGEQLAKRMKCSSQTVGRHEQGEEGEEPSYETLCGRFRALGFPEEAVDVMASGLEPAFRPLAPPGVSWWLTLEDRARLRKVAALSGAEWGRDAEAWLVASAEQALEERDRREAAALGAELRRLPAGERRPRVEGDPRFHTWAVCVLLCERSARSTLRPVSVTSSSGRPRRACSPRSARWLSSTTWTWVSTGCGSAGWGPKCWPGWAGKRKPV